MNLVEWCIDVTPVTVVVPCSGADHRITWRRGKLVLEDHDLAAEAAMSALGSAVPECVRVLQRWRLRTGWEPSRVGFQPPRAAPPIPFELLQMRELTSVLAWERAWRRDPHSREATLLGRKLRKHALAPLLDSVRAAAERVGSASISGPDVSITSGRPAMQGWIDRGGATAAAWLPPSWLYRVWARHMALVERHLVVELDPDMDSLTRTGRVVRWVEQAEGGLAPEVAEARFEMTAEGWSLR